jgi:lysophospholipase L1-like esterase
VVQLLSVAAAAGGVTGAAAAQGPSAVGLIAVSPARTGWIGLDVTAPPGSAVTLSEVADGARTPFRTVTMTGPELAIARAMPWRCDRRVRQLEADATAPSGARSAAAVTVRTPSCAHRFAVTVRPRTAARVGRRLTVTVRDSWKTGGTAARVCLRVHARSACRRIRVPRTRRGARARLTVRRAGLGSLTLSGTGFRMRERLETRGRHTPLRLLATGDSMIQIIDSLLERSLREAHVTSDARISTGISTPFVFNWVEHARAESSRLRPQVTVMFLGANDGFPIGKADCCGSAWIAAYARRARLIMRDYRRRGAGRVYWLTIPAPRDPHRRPIYHAVNQAIERAAASFPADEVAVIDLVRVFTPGGVYRASIRGRVVRQADGIHLSVAGARLAAAVIHQRLRADALIP